MAMRYIHFKTTLAIVFGDGFTHNNIIDSQKSERLEAGSFLCPWTGSDLDNLSLAYIGGDATMISVAIVIPPLKKDRRKQAVGKLDLNTFYILCVN